METVGIGMGANRAICHESIKRFWVLPTSPTVIKFWRVGVFAGRLRLVFPIPCRLSHDTYVVQALFGLFEKKTLLSFGWGSL